MRLRRKSPVPLMTDSSSGESERSQKSGDSAVADGEAMARLRHGDDVALNELMDRWRKPVLAYLYRMTGDYETAADLAQEVFVRLYRNRRKYRPTGSVSSYIFTIAANLAKNHFRWRKRHPETALSDEIAAFLGADSSSLSPAKSLENSERGTEIREAVQKLPEKLKTPLLLFHFNELAQAEIAKILNCSVKTVETRLYRARKLLKNDLTALREK